MPDLILRTGLLRAAEELAAVGYRFDVEQDRISVRIARQIIDDIAEIDVGHVAQRDEVREPDSVLIGPIEDRRT